MQYDFNMISNRFDLIRRAHCFIFYTTSQTVRLNRLKKERRGKKRLILLKEKRKEKSTWETRM